MSAGADADARKQSAISQNEQTLLWLANQSLLTTAYFFPCRSPPSEVVPSFHLMVPPGEEHPRRRGQTYLVRAGQRGETLQAPITASRRTSPLFKSPPSLRHLRNHCPRELRRRSCRRSVTLVTARKSGQQKKALIRRTRNRGHANVPKEPCQQRNATHAYAYDDTFFKHPVLS